MLRRAELMQLYLCFSFEEMLVSWILSPGLQSHCSEPVNSPAPAQSHGFWRWIPVEGYLSPGAAPSAPSGGLSSEVLASTLEGARMLGLKGQLCFPLKAIPVTAVWEGARAAVVLGAQIGSIRCLLLKLALVKGRGEKMFYICTGPKRSLVGGGLHLYQPEEKCSSSNPCCLLDCGE